MVGRAATELAIHLLGGQHRLNPSNMHQVTLASDWSTLSILASDWSTLQVPTAVFLCGTSSVSALGLAAARHLASHGVKTQVSVFIVVIVKPWSKSKSLCPNRHPSQIKVPQKRRTEGFGPRAEPKITCCCFRSRSHLYHYFASLLTLYCYCQVFLPDAAKYPSQVGGELKWLWFSSTSS